MSISPKRISGQSPRAVPPLSKKHKPSHRVEKLLREMTLEEKIGQMNQFTVNDDTGPMPDYPASFKDVVATGKVGSILNVIDAKAINAFQKIAVEKSPHHIPVLFAYDIIHGFKVISPIPLAQAASFEPSVVHMAARAAGREGRAAGIRWTFAPNVDVTRDPRWGRVAEGPGEDPFLGSVMADAAVRGFHEGGLLSTVKHFAGYGKVQAGREYNTVDMSERSLREVYLPPFQAAIDAGVDSVMPAFNDLNGTPMTTHKKMLTGELGRMGFDGVVVTDFSAIKETIDHGTSADLADAARKAANAGIDMDMHSVAFLKHLEEEVKAGRVPMSRIDDAVRRILEAKERAGLFDNPYADESAATRKKLISEVRADAYEAAKKSIVLLKNEGNVLPLAGVKKLGLVGPLVDNALDQLGTWHAQGDKPNTSVTLLEAMKEKAKARGIDLAVAQGSSIAGAADDDVQIAAAVKATEDSDVIIAAVGESEAHSGEARSRTSLDLPGNQQKLLKALLATGKPVVMVLHNGRPLTLPWEAENVPAIVEAWHLGTMHGPAVADVLFGDYNPGGKLPVSFPRNVGQIPIHYDLRSTGRPAEKPGASKRFSSKYIDAPNSPQFPFGFGLSYTTFDIAPVQVDSAKVPKDGTVVLRTQVKNTGKVTGDEVVQLYIGDVVASVTQPKRRLFGFERVTLEPGESKEIVFKVPVEQLAIYDGDMNKVVEPGLFNAYIGNSSEAAQGTQFEVLP